MTIIQVHSRNHTQNNKWLATQAGLGYQSWCIRLKDCLYAEKWWVLSICTRTTGSSVHGHFCITLHKIIDFSSDHSYPHLLFPDTFEYENFPRVLYMRMQVSSSLRKPRYQLANFKFNESMILNITQAKDVCLHWFGCWKNHFFSPYVASGNISVVQRWYTGIFNEFRLLDPCLESISHAQE